MQKLIVAASAAAILVISSWASMAAEMTGVIANIDEHANSVTLEDGSVYLLPPTFSVDAVKEGQTVVITYDTDANGQNVATAVIPQL